MTEQPQIVHRMIIEREKAWDALGRYKFLMFGYHAACWVNLRKLCKQKPRNPFVELVHLAKEKAKGKEEEGND